MRKSDLPWRSGEPGKRAGDGRYLSSNLQDLMMKTDKRKVRSITPILPRESVKRPASVMVQEEREGVLVSIKGEEGKQEGRGRGRGGRGRKSVLHALERIPPEFADQTDSDFHLQEQVRSFAKQGGWKREEDGGRGGGRRRGGTLLQKFSELEGSPSKRQHHVWRRRRRSSSRCERGKRGEEGGEETVGRVGRGAEAGDGRQGIT